MSRDRDGLWLLVATIAVMFVVFLIQRFNVGGPRRAIQPSARAGTERTSPQSTAVDALDARDRPAVRSVPGDLAPLSGVISSAGFVARVVVDDRLPSRYQTADGRRPTGITGAGKLSHNQREASEIFTPMSFRVIEILRGDADIAGVVVAPRDWESADIGLTKERMGAFREYLLFAGPLPESSELQGASEGSRYRVKYMREVATTLSLDDERYEAVLIMRIVGISDDNSGVDLGTGATINVTDVGTEVARRGS